MQLSRRGLLGGLVALVAAPAIVRVESLMVLPAPAVLRPTVGEVLRIRLPADFIVQETAVDFAVKNTLMTIDQITREAVALFRNSNAFIRNLDMQYDEQFVTEGARIGTYLQVRPVGLLGVAPEGRRATPSDG